MIQEMRVIVPRAWGLHLLLFGILAGCGSGEDPPATEDSPFGKEPEGPLPPLTTESRFAADVGKAVHPAAAGPKEPLLIRFDFRKKASTAYDFEQKVENEMTMGTSREGTRQKADGTGILLLKSRGDGTGDMVMKDLKLTMTMNPGKDEKTMAQSSPPVVVQGVKEDGSMKVGNNSVEVMLDILFPIPEKPLAVGETADIPGRVPFNAMGSILHAEGVSRVTHAGYVTLAGRTCARLETEIDISKLDVPEEITARYLISTRGRSVFYYDVAARTFVEGEVALIMSVRADAPMPKIEFPQMKGKAPPMPSTMRMVTDSDNRVRIALSRVQPAAAEASGEAEKK